jgi:hypothetical protein
MRQSRESRPKPNPPAPGAEKTILHYPKAKGDLERLRKAGADPEVVLGLLNIYAKVIRRPQKWYWATGSGKSALTLKRFPERLASFADEIQRVNAHPLLDTRCSLQRLGDWETPAVRDALTKNLSLLPKLLREYSLLLKIQVRTIEHLLERARRRHQTIETTLQLALVGYVRHTTGETFYPQIAKLLTAACAASGRHRDFDPRTVARLSERHPEILEYLRVHRPEKRP